MNALAGLTPKLRSFTFRGEPPPPTRKLIREAREPEFQRFAFMAKCFDDVLIVGECMGIDPSQALEHCYTQLLDCFPSVWPVYSVTLVGQ